MHRGLKTGRGAQEPGCSSRPWATSSNCLPSLHPAENISTAQEAQAAAEQRSCHQSNKAAHAAGASHCKSCQQAAAASRLGGDPARSRANVRCCCCCFGCDCCLVVGAGTKRPVQQWDSRCTGRWCSQWWSASARATTAASWHTAKAVRHAVFNAHCTHSRHSRSHSSSSSSIVRPEGQL
jgi:hypothetical protein